MKPEQRAKEAEMFEAGAVRKTRRLARWSVTLGVILLFSSIGMSLTIAAPNDTPPGQDQCDDGHGANDKPCKDDNEHGNDCEEHGQGGVNEDHCIPEGSTTGDTTTGGSTTGGSTGDTSTTGETTTGETTTGETSTGETTTGETTTGETTTGETTTGETTGDTSTGAGTGSTTGTPVVEDDDAEVLGRQVTRKPLATTGNETTVLAILGLGLLMLGSALRFGRFGTQIAVATGADELVSRSLMLIERQSRTGSRYWNHRF